VSEEGTIIYKKAYGYADFGWGINKKHLILILNNIRNTKTQEIADRIYEVLD